MKPLRLLAAARAEFLHETRYYEATRAGTGRRFRESVAAAFDRIERQPQTGAPDEAGCRRLRVKGFPFSVVYREEPEAIVVYAIRPDARKPGYWQSRARDGAGTPPLRSAPLICYPVEAFGKPLAQALRETPAPQGTEVLLKVGQCGLCHSDLHLQDGYYDLGDGQKLDVSKGLNLPRVLGHEIAGTVVALGPDATGIRLGDKRVVYPWLGCGQCSTCARGDQHLCPFPQAIGVHRDGGFADHVLVRAPDVLLDYGRVPEAQACTYACAGVTAYSALKKAAPHGQLAAGDPLLIIGAGGVGLSAIRLARRLYPDAKLIVAEIDPSKWDLAREAGAAEVIDPRADGGVRALVKATQGGVASAIDFVGADSSFAFGYGALRKGGKLVCVGLMGGATSVQPVMVAMKAVTVQGSYVGSLAELRELFALANEQPLPALPVTERPLAQADASLADLRAGRVRGRVVLLP